MQVRTSPSFPRTSKTFPHKHTKQGTQQQLPAESQGLTGRHHSLSQAAANSHNIPMPQVGSSNAAQGPTAQEIVDYARYIGMDPVIVFPVSRVCAH